MRTTLDIDKPVLDELKALGKREKKSLGKITSSLLAAALKQNKIERMESELNWISKPMGARVDIHDKDALYRILDQE